MTVENTQKLFRKHGGVMRTREALAHGVHAATLYKMRDTGELEELSRGVYGLPERTITENEDLITVALRIPRAHICLISALAFHELTTQIPRSVYCALPRNVHRPRIDYPPMRFFRFSDASYAAGIESHIMNGTTVYVYSAEKTLVDCFKFRNQIGMDTVIEALRFYGERKRVQIDDLMTHARTCRVENIIKPYLEAMF
ncbi:MAG: transcriptional regulator [Spartobacteria bacterium]|nr:transcriptional regulator [Spartobacteria bacterium]